MRFFEAARIKRMHEEGMSAVDITAQFRGLYTQAEVEAFIPKPKRGRPKKVKTEEVTHDEQGTDL